jgi:hypothetical protein
VPDDQTAAAWAAIDKIIKPVERAIVRSYRAALDEIRSMLAGLYERYADSEGLLTHAEMTKYNRLRALHDQIVKILGPVYSANGQLVGKLTRVVYEESFYRHGYALAKAADVDISWGLLNESAVRAAVEKPYSGLTLAKVWTRAKAGALSDIERAVIQGAVQGDSYVNMARRVRKAFDTNAKRALLIAQTEGHRMAVEGELAAYDEAEEQGLQFARVWDATLDDRTRPAHQEMDGKEAENVGTEDEPHWQWHYPGIGWVDGPGLTGVAEADINCLPGDALIYGRPRAAFRRWYEGSLYTVTTDVGMVLSVTPNHPILTSVGWVPAKVLKKGDYVIGGSFREPMAFGDGDVQRMPVTAQEVFDFLALSGANERVRGVTSQFHGDGRDGYVNVVLPHWVLGAGINPAFGQPVDKLLLSDANEPAPLRSAQHKFSFRTTHTTDSGVSGVCEARALDWTGSSHTDIHGLAAPPEWRSGFSQKAGDNIPADAEAFCELFNRNGLFGVETHEIISVDVRDFVGHVYNLHTVDGCYYAQNSEVVNGSWFITHNCRCIASTVFKGYEPKSRTAREVTTRTITKGPRKGQRVIAGVEGAGNVVGKYRTYEEWAETQGVAR